MSESDTLITLRPITRETIDAYARLVADQPDDKPAASMNPSDRVYQLCVDLIRANVQLGQEVLRLREELDRLHADRGGACPEEAG